MYVVGARVTFPNELTKQSIKSYMTSELEGMNKMIMSFKIDTSPTQHLVINDWWSGKSAEIHSNSKRSNGTDICVLAKYSLIKSSC